MERGTKRDTMFYLKSDHSRLQKDIMQTNPLYISQLARHTKLPLYLTVQDYTEEPFRCRTTLPPLSSAFAK